MKLGLGSSLGVDLRMKLLENDWNDLGRFLVRTKRRILGGFSKKHARKEIYKPIKIF